ncbi:hypothetical protein KJ969_03690 [Patescibacteria group bacterium]|nr:hypothetical protein [Patescibacteria group bacterium]MBU1922220.1 hypothetical protein [Patescibacteria group bacterium]
MKKQLKIIISIVIGVIVILGLIFYWYSYRPSSIISECSFEAKDKAIEKGKDNGASDGKFNADDRNTYYEWCLQEKGLVK